MEKEYKKYEEIPNFTIVWKDETYYLKCDSKGFRFVFYYKEYTDNFTYGYISHKSIPLYFDSYKIVTEKEVIDKLFDKIRNNLIKNGSMNKFKDFFGKIELENSEDITKFQKIYYNLLRPYLSCPQNEPVISYEIRANNDVNFSINTENLIMDDIKYHIIGENLLAEKEHKPNGKYTIIEIEGEKIYIPSNLYQRSLHYLFDKFKKI